MALHPRPKAARRKHRLSVRQAVVLGLIQGPTEALPLSSSGHLVLIPALLGWPYAELPADTRKTFEVALHTGAGLALAWLLRDDVIACARDPLGSTLRSAPAAIVGFAFEDRIERRASGPVIAARAQIAAGAAMAAADGCPQAGGVTPRHTGDNLAVGLAQCLALVPGVSRNGATLTSARLRGLDPEAAARISWRAGLPIMAGATVLKGARVAQRGLDQELRIPFAAGALAAFASTLASAPLLRIRRHRVAGAYRVLLGALALRRLHRLEWPRG